MINRAGRLLIYESSTFHDVAGKARTTRWRMIGDDRMVVPDRGASPASQETCHTC
jgi:hypothetical protein